MSPQVLYDLPPFDDGEYEGYSLEMTDGDARLRVRACGTPDVILEFRKVRWQQFVSTYSCSQAMASEAYFRLVAYPESPSLADFIASDRSRYSSQLKLGHFRVFIPDAGCHEFYAQSARAI